MRPPILKRSMVIAAVFFAVGCFLRLPVHAVKIPANASTFPQTIGAWESRAGSLDEVSVLGADVTVSREYLSPGEEPIELYVGYFESQAQSKEVAGYRTEKFLVKDHSIEDSHVFVNGLRVRKIIQRHGNAYQVLLCWYEIDGQSLADSWKVMLRTIQNGVLHRRTSGAIVVVATDYEHDEQLHSQVERLGTFIHTVLPDIRAFLTTT